MFANHRTKYLYGIGVAACTYLLYSATNHSHLFASRFLTVLPFEKRLPLVPWTIWIYLTSFFVMIFIFFDIRDLENLHRLTYAFLILQLFCNLVFVLFPVAVPRELSPLPGDIGPITRWLFNYTRTVDTPRNCLPSLHVANSCLISLVYLKENRLKFLFAAAWVLLVSFSTLATKQHYFWDVIAGIAIAVILFRLAFNQRFLILKAPAAKRATRSGSEIVCSATNLPAGTNGYDEP
jgi:membrane-associated phospholipid phosphatase